MAPLTHHDRTRLLRSTRKLGAVLGTTPQCHFVHDASHVALELVPGPGPALVLRIHTTALPTLPGPLSPVSPVRKPDERRRRMAKLARTFGENVPPELVAPVPPRRRRRSTLAPMPAFDEEVSEKTPLLSRSTSVRAAPKTPVVKDEVRAHSVDEGERSRSLYWGRRKEKDWSGEWNRRDRDDVLMQLRALKASL
ncbi:hypothetical protein IW261DRAFT_1419026 [Armillaria novae-zelandiae]|uniref:Uncharacterized protein n=1 Tax=Armillaria novae-zelandiae TaxID=153914 RepID=A0AA39U931_9AGAR|nr:hypothetical protein IW261DRAFT_1419026 [Armillaria novae-zelandiae]